MKKYHRRKLLCAFSTALVLLLILTNAFSAQNRFRKPTDFDGDGKTDFAIILATTFNQTIVVDESLSHSLKVFALSYSQSGTRMGDLTGDGKADFFVSNNLYDVTITDYATRSVRSQH